jgi:hypothetical protein
MNDYNLLNEELNNFDNNFYNNYLSDVIILNLSKNLLLKNFEIVEIFFDKNLNHFIFNKFFLIYFFHFSSLFYYYIIICIIIY